MRLSPVTGIGLMGIGGATGNVSINGVVPAALSTMAGGGWGWLDTADDIIAGQGDFGAGYLLRQYVISTTTVSVLDSTPSGVTDAATQFRAGDNKWAAFLTGGALVGVRSTITSRLPLSSLGDLDASGRMAVVQNYASDAGIVVYNSIGAQLWVNPTTVLVGTERLRMKDGIVAYQDTATHWHLRSATDGTLQAFAPRTDDIPAWTVPVSISGVIWVVEVTGTQITIRPATSSNGFVLATSPNLFNPDAVSLSAGTVRVGWSVTTGESPTSMRLADLTIGTGGVNTGTTASGALVITAAPPAPASTLPVGPIEGGGGLLSKKQPRQALKASSFVGDERGKTTYQRWWDQVADQAFAPINLSSGVTGTLPTDNGGTGGSSGTTNVNGGNLLPGTVTTTQLGPMFAPSELIPPVSLTVASNISAIVNRSLTLGTAIAVTLEAGSRLRIL